VSQTTTDRHAVPDPEPPLPSSPNGATAPSSPANGRDGQGAQDDHERLARLEEDVRAYRISRDSWTFVVLGVAVAVLFGAVISIGFAQHSKGGQGAAAAGQTITASLSEYKIALSADQVVPNSKIAITNGGTMAHNLGVKGTDLVTPNIPPGGTATLDLSSLQPGQYTIYCEIPGHAPAGMTTSLTISESASAAAPADAAAAMGMTAEEHAAMSADDGAAMDQKMLDSMAAFPAPTAGKGNQVLEPTVLPDGTKHFELTAAVIDWEVTPGKTVKAWAYNGQVPGPRINLEVGDKVEVQLTNQLPLGTDIHWHGINTPNDQDGVAPITQELVKSGGSYTYRFTAVEPAIGMYHAHAHGEEAVPNGLFGTMYIGHVTLPAGRTVSGIAVPTDVAPVQDVPMVLNDAGVIGLSLNGKGFPATEPVVVHNGDWVEVTYFNEGLQAHPMHLHGFPQIVFAKDGMPLDQPYAADTILVGPGERYTVLFQATRVGTWVWHCHILNHAEGADGMFGMVTALVVQ
jgi:FtsP/CotA-like multicopper oxidase with cupredoxin domain